MAVVMDYYDGNCHIQICDDYVVKTKEENDRIIDNVIDIYMQQFDGRKVTFTDDPNVKLPGL